MNWIENLLSIAGIKLHQDPSLPAWRWSRKKGEGSHMKSRTPFASSRQRGPGAFQMHIEVMAK